ncbi:MAG: site-specific integrase, partial [Candidatus Nanohaloarchaea archaeon]
SSEHTKETANQCEKSVSPHIIRQASITYWRSQDIPVEVVSDRMNVSRDVIEKHYDRRSKEGKAQQRRKYLNNI